MCKQGWWCFFIYYTLLVFVHCNFWWIQNWKILFIFPSNKSSLSINKSAKRSNPSSQSICSTCGKTNILLSYQHHHWKIEFYLWWIKFNWSSQYELTEIMGVTLQLIVLLEVKTNLAPFILEWIMKSSFKMIVNIWQETSLMFSFIHLLIAWYFFS